MNLYKVTISLSIGDEYIYVVADGMDRAGEVAILRSKYNSGSIKTVELLCENVLIDEKGEPE